VYVVTYTEAIMAIGCEQHTIEKWHKFDDGEISGMDVKALEFWKKWKPILSQIGVFDSVLVEEKK
jgi:hypothetical protein